MGIHNSDIMTQYLNELPYKDNNFIYGYKDSNQLNIKDLLSGSVNDLAKDMRFSYIDNLVQKNINYVINKTNLKRINSNIDKYRFEQNQMSKDNNHNRKNSIKTQYLKLKHDRFKSKSHLKDPLSINSSEMH